VVRFSLEAVVQPQPQLQLSASCSVRLPSSQHLCLRENALLSSSARPHSPIFCLHFSISSQGTGSASASSLNKVCLVTCTLAIGSVTRQPVTDRLQFPFVWQAVIIGFKRVPFAEKEKLIIGAIPPVVQGRHSWDVAKVDCPGILKQMLFLVVKTNLNFLQHPPLKTLPRRMMESFAWKPPTPEISRYPLVEFPLSMQEQSPIRLIKSLVAAMYLSLNTSSISTGMPSTVTLQGSIEDGHDRSKSLMITSVLSTTKFKSEQSRSEAHPQEHPQEHPQLWQQEQSPQEQSLQPQGSSCGSKTDSCCSKVSGVVQT